MNVKSTLDLLMGRLGGRTSPELRAKALQEMVFFQENECEGGEELPWFLITERAETDTEIGEPRIPLPTDFIREVEDSEPLFYDTDGELLQLEKTSWQDLEDRYINADPSTPAVYVIRGNNIILGPAPDRILTVRFPTYYAREEPPVDSGSSENGWFKHASDLMMAGPGLVVATLHLKDAELIQTMAGLLARARQRLDRVITAREEANRNRRMG